MTKVMDKLPAFIRHPLIGFFWVSVVCAGIAAAILVVVFGSIGLFNLGYFTVTHVGWGKILITAAVIVGLLFCKMIGAEVELNQRAKGKK